MTIEPIRVSSRDLQKEKKKRKGFKHFPAGSCYLLHPSFDLLDEHGCSVIYNLEQRIIHVFYDDKQLLTPNIESVTEIVGKYYGKE